MLTDIKVGNEIIFFMKLEKSLFCLWGRGLWHLWIIALFVFIFQTTSRVWSCNVVFVYKMVHKEKSTPPTSSYGLCLLVRVKTFWYYQTFLMKIISCKRFLHSRFAWSVLLIHFINVLSWHRTDISLIHSHLCQDSRYQTNGDGFIWLITEALITIKMSVSVSLIGCMPKQRQLEAVWSVPPVGGARLIEG